MKSIFTFIIPILISTTAWGQISNSAFDQTLSDKLGADQYGMKMYVFVILKTGDNKTQEKSFIDSCFAGHMANMERLSKANQLIVAGPFGKNEADFRGLFILNVKTIKEASALLETDPAIKSNLLKAELYPWYGSAALPEYLDAHNKIWKTKP
ncbi:MAG: YciI family protein [Leadbetterella sp.]|nr:YciI family protein [Leadbetterella sp.]